MTCNQLQGDERNQPRSSRVQRWLESWLTILAAILLASTAAAQPSPSKKAAAEALFEKGAELLSLGNTAKACEKFESSQALDPALGTMLRLADCYDRLGRTASAWALFRQVSATARAQEQRERQAIADERANDLEARLSKLSLSFESPFERPRELRLNGIPLPEGSWDTELPVDPGTQLLEASSPGRRSFRETVQVAPGPALVTVHVPKLLPLAQEPRLRKLAEPPAKAPPTQANSWHVLGYVATGLGGASLATSTVFAYLAWDKNRKSLERCRQGEPNACTQEGVDLRDQARSAANIATITAIAGGVLLTAGITLVVFTPRAEELGVPASKVSATLTPGGLRLSGEF